MATPLRILSIFGTRPEAIKMAPLVLALSSASDFDSCVLLTAQHREMLDQVLTLFGIQADHDLNVMQREQTLDYVVSQVLSKLTPLLKAQSPEVVLVHGDTVTTFAAALAAFYLKIPVGHVEAGLRSYDIANPFPEESNRVLADHLCVLHFAPTVQARANLLKENISEKGIFVTGNTVTDALHIALESASGWEEPLLQRLQRDAKLGGRLLLLTAHRRENHGAPLEQVFRALRRIVDEHADVSLVYPVHLNPQVQQPAQAVLGNHSRIHLVPPVNYRDLVHLMKDSYFIVTDSGGIQEEAPSLGKPVLVLRKVTERPEAVSAGTAKVIGVEESSVYAETRALLKDNALYRRMAEAINPYGDGQAAGRIIEGIRYYFGRTSARPPDFNAGERRSPLNHQS